MQSSFVELNLQLNDLPRLVKNESEKSQFNSDDELKQWFGVQ